MAWPSRHRTKTGARLRCHVLLQRDPDPALSCLGRFGQHGRLRTVPVALDAAVGRFAYRRYRRWQVDRVARGERLCGNRRSHGLRSQRNEVTGFIPQCQVFRELLSGDAAFVCPDRRSDEVSVMLERLMLTGAAIVFTIAGGSVARCADNAVNLPGGISPPEYASQKKD